MPATRHHSAWFLCGLFVMAVVIGFVAGASASPIVSVLIPLLFGIASTASTVLATKNAPDYEAAVARAYPLIGQQMIVFSIGFAFGLWSGIFARLQPMTLWLRDAPSAAYGNLHFEDLATTRAIIELDRQMVADGIALEERRRILKHLSRPTPPSNANSQVAVADPKSVNDPTPVKPSNVTAPPASSTSTATAATATATQGAPPIKPKPEVLPPPLTPAPPIGGGGYPDLLPP